MGQDLISVLSVEIGFFHGVTRKAFGDPHRGGCEQWYRFIGGKIKDCPRCPASHPRPGGSALSGCRSPASGASGPRVSSPSPGGPGPRDVELLCVSFPIYVTARALWCWDQDRHCTPGHACAASGGEEREQMNLRPLLHFPYVALGL